MSESERPIGTVASPAIGEPSARLLDALAAVGVIDRRTPPPMTPLTGGVSSDIWRLDVGNRRLVAKQALPRLKVAGDWRAPVTRTRYEAAWLRRAHSIRSGLAPDIVASSDEVIVMEYLEPALHPVWKGTLLAGHVDPSVAAALGERLAAVHAATAGDVAVADEFDSAALFRALRLAPFFEATARVQPDVAAPLHALARSFEANAKALVHGDVSPKNVLVGPRGPILLDAECATWGDPSFDVAFCSTHLLLKMVAVPAAADPLACSLEMLVAAYGEGLTWEAPDSFWRRAAMTTAGLLLARVDGLSPVEYLSPTQQSIVRGAAKRLLAAPIATIDKLIARWHAVIGGLDQ